MVTGATLKLNWLILCATYSFDARENDAGAVPNCVGQTHFRRYRKGRFDTWRDRRGRHF